MIATKREPEDPLNGHADRPRAWGVERSGTFGACASGEQNAGSDLGTVAVFGKAVFCPGQERFGNLVEVADFLESQTGRRVDLPTPNSLRARRKQRMRSQLEYVVPHAA